MEKITNKNDNQIIQLWKITLTKFKKNVKNTTINQYYLNEIEFKKIQDNLIILIVKDNYIKWILNKFKKEFENIVLEVFQTNLEISFLTPLEYKSKYLDKNNLEKESEKDKKSLKLLDIENLKKFIKIIPEYNFDNFLMYENNKIAFNSAFIISEKNNQDWNPLYIFGNTGVGKTHLLHAIANELIKKRKNPILLNSDVFLLLFISNITKNNKNNYFFEYFLNFLDDYDYFLIDDIQFLDNKEKTIEFFFFIFNWFINKNKQVVIVSDRLPKQLKNINKRLISRFENGLIVNIKKIDENSAIKLLKLKLKEYKIFKLEEEVYKYIVENFNENIRQLLGCIKRLMFYCLNDNKNKENNIITLKTAKEALSIFDSQISENKKIDKIVELFSTYFKIDKKIIFSNSKVKQNVLIREMFIYFLKNIENIKNKNIADFLNKKESQIIYSLKNFNCKLKKNLQFKNTINELKELLKK
ncbi:DnaA ATPase domain-containing protein [Mycoplasma sp. SG1]|uniref:DnaA ATPase domain-containing protein n=1 Tax=Mycoplasma sp. SG1 TaxID=2810348 RepID=UPI00202499EA|nr:DnaA/Hda family protein [Mycoplasma sp. SG1]URM52844.1 hypothetical protein JRW51_00665 [Mycoplasma sp. SG1]